MRRLVVLFLLAAAAFAQTGDFSDSDDVGAPPIQGAVTYDDAAKTYTITGSGADIWARADQFHYVWREMSGDFAVSATAKFLTDGIAHRKAVIQLRRSLDTDSQHLQLAIHGDGTPSIQFRAAKGETTHTVDFPIEGPGVWRMKLERRGEYVTFWMGKDSAPLRKLGTTINTLGSPILVGLGVASHTVEAVNTVEFSDVRVEQLAPAGDLGIFTDSGDVGDPAIEGSTEFSDGVYRLIGSGNSMWGATDQFQYVWKQVTGNFTANATVKFEGEGHEHRKAGIMVRQSLEGDSAYGDFVIHGQGMPSIQWRGSKGDDTRTFNLPYDEPGKFRIKLVRRGVRIYAYLSSDGAEPQEIAHTEVSFRGPVLVGLFVSSHDPAATDTVTFTDVSLEMAPPPAPRQ